MSFGFPAFSTSSQQLRLGQEELVGAVSEALSNLGWPYERPSPNKFFAKLSVGLWSWGEKLIVDVGHDGTVMARSECVLVTQCFDWGKNARNVNQFFSELSRITQA